MSQGKEMIGERPLGTTAARKVLAGKGGLPVEGMGNGAPSAAALAEALAVLMVDLVAVLPAVDRDASLERLANRLDDRGRTPNGTGAARLLGEVGATLMRIGC